jgi:hypothetical protein
MKILFSLFVLIALALPVSAQTIITVYTQQPAPQVVYAVQQQPAPQVVYVVRQAPQPVFIAPPPTAMYLAQPSFTVQTVQTVQTVRPMGFREAWHRQRAAVIAARQSGW